VRGAERSMRISADLLRLQDTTAQIRVRGAVVLLIGFAAIAEQLGLEVILGAFAAGAVLALLDRLKAGEVPGLDPDDRIGLLDELDDVLSKLAFARSEDDAIQLRVVV